MNKVIMIILFGLSLVSWKSQEFQTTTPKEIWVDSVYQSMSMDERIAQMFMVRAFSHKDKVHTDKIRKLINDHKIGGLCFFQGDPREQARLINEYQELTDIPLLVAIDAEWGLGMRFKESAISFPYQLTLGSLSNNDLIYQMGVEVANQLRRIGVHINFAPVVDINNNPNNPVINFRSFGEDRYNVSAKSYAYALGLQDGGVMACAKHFPGHGDTDVDSHYDLPVILHDRKRLDSIELLPFKVLAQNGVKSAMVAHLQVPAIDQRENRPLTLSNLAIQGILQNELGFEGLVMTDALDMKGVTKHFAQGEIELEAFFAGNDLLLLSEAVDKGIGLIKAAIQQNVVSELRLEYSVKKILRAKYDFSLYKKPVIEDLDQILDDINNPKAIALKYQLFEEAITLVKNNHSLLPIKDLQNIEYASLSIGSESITDFQKRLSSYTDITHYNSSKSFSSLAATSLINELKKKDLVFVSFHNMSQYASKDFGLDSTAIRLVKELNKSTKVVLTLFGNPYALAPFDFVPWLICAYQDEPIVQDLTAQAIFGAISFKGSLPVTSSERFKFGDGIKTISLERLGYTIPERVGMSSDSLMAIDTIVEEMIREEAAPGCQVLIAKDGKIVFHKAYGHHTYATKVKVSEDDVYDVASVTKILATTIGIMKLYDENKFNLLAPVELYLSLEDTCNKRFLIIEDIMAHHAGLRGWIPFYVSTLEEDLKKATPKLEYYRTALEPKYDVKVTDKMFLRTDYPDTIWQKILSCSLRDRRDYRYSDLGFYMLHKMINNISGIPINNFVEQQFYNPLGLRRTGYLPHNRISINQIVPSEKDEYFRRQIIRGHVHDMGAAMLGGVSGHAGLFSNAYELGILMQMLLNGGKYGGIEYMKAETVDRFTRRFYRSTRRGIGFDMKEINPNKTINMSEKASSSTFGHLGFTGTAAFADPRHNVIYIFLSNRTFPTMENQKFGKNEYRPRIQSVIYNALDH